MTSDRILERGTARIAYSVEGPEDAAHTLVVAHGMLSSRADEDAARIFDWAPVAAAGIRLVRYDARGHGRSTGRLEPADWRWTALAEDLLALIDVVSPDAPVDVRGASMGTGTAITAAVKAPERFRRLVLHIPPTAWSTRPAQAAQYVQMADFVERYGLAKFVEGATAFPPLAILAAGGWPTLPNPDVAESLLPTVLRGAATADMPDPRAVAALTQPALLLPWQGDPAHPVSTADQLAGLLPDTTTRLAGSPEDIRAWPQAIVDFLLDAEEISAA